MSIDVRKCRGFEISVEIRIEVKDKRVAEALVAAIRPDDRTAPPGLEIEENVVDGDLLVKVRACGRSLGTVRNTVDEVLEYTYAALKAVEEVAQTLK